MPRASCITAACSTATDEEWDFAFDLNVKSMHRTIKAFLPGMLAKGGGSIINIASTVGRLQGRAQPLRLRRDQGRRGRASPRRWRWTSSARASAATASAPAPSRRRRSTERIKALGKQVGGEEKARAMFIERQPMGRLGTAEEMAHVAVYLASDEFDLHDGSSITPDGGFTL